MPDLTEQVTDAARTALLNHKSARMVARRNSASRFTTWAMPTVVDAITDAIDPRKETHCLWFNAFCQQKAQVHENHELIVRVCNEVWDKLNRRVS